MAFAVVLVVQQGVVVQERRGRVAVVVAAAGVFAELPAGPVVRQQLEKAVAAAVVAVALLVVDISPQEYPSL